MGREKETEKGRKWRVRAKQKKQRGHPPPNPARLTTKRNSNSNSSSSSSRNGSRSRSNAPAMRCINSAAGEAEAKAPGQVQVDLQRGVQMQTLAFQARVRTRPSTISILPFWLRGGFQRRILSRLRREHLRLLAGQGMIILSTLNSQIQRKFPFGAPGILVFPETFTTDSFNACINVFVTMNMVRTSQLFEDFATISFKDCFDVDRIKDMTTLPTVFEARLPTEVWTISLTRRTWSSLTR